MYFLFLIPWHLEGFIQYDDVQFAALKHRTGDLCNSISRPSVSTTLTDANRLPFTKIVLRFNSDGLIMSKLRIHFFFISENRILDGKCIDSRRFSIYWCLL